MRKGILGSLAVLTVGAGLTFGQPKSPPPPPGGPSMLPPPGAGAPPGGPVGPDGQPYLAPSGFDGMVPGGGPMYGDPGMMPPDGGAYGSGNGILSGLFGARNGPPHFWATGEYLFWVPSSFVAPYPIVTTSAPLELGVVGGTTTASLMPGNRNITFPAESGFRVSAGVALDQSAELGVEAAFFWVNTARRDYEFSSNTLGTPVLAIPFQDINTGAQASYIVSYPGVSYGSISVKTESQICGAEANLVYNAYGYQNGPGGLTLLVGPRYIRLREQLDIDTSSTNVGAIPAGLDLGSSFLAAGGLPFAGNPLLIPTTVSTADRIRTTNEFYGGQVGFRGDIGFGSWFINLTGKFGAGYMRETVEIQGGSTAAVGGTSALQPGGVYTIAQDLGEHHRDAFSIMSEGSISVGCQIVSCLRIWGGYNCLWINNVARPTRELSPILNPSLIPTSPTFTGTSAANIYPRGLTNQTSYYLHGFTAGLEFEF